MHILIIPSWYPENKTDIFGSFFREQAIALSKEDIQVGVIYPNLKSLKTFVFRCRSAFNLQKENDSGVITYRLTTYNWIPKIFFVRTYLWSLFGLYLFKRYIKENGKPDLIHVHSMLNGCALAKKIFNKYNIPFVVTEHSSQYIREQHSPEIIRNALVLAHSAKKCFAVSQSLAEFLESKDKNTTWEFLPNMVHQSFFEEKLHFGDGFQFIHIARLNKNKGTDHLLRAFSNSFKDHSNVVLKICGDGPEEDSLKLLANYLGIDKQVRFLGSLSRLEILKQISNSHVLVVASFFETFSVVTAEALAVGIPVVATKCGGPESILKETDGILIDSGSDLELSRGMEFIFNNYSLYDSLKIKQSCYERFSEKAIINKLKAHYKNILNET